MVGRGVLGIYVAIGVEVKIELRWGSGWCDVWRGGGQSEVPEDTGDHLWLLNVGDVAHVASTVGANEHVEVEYPLQ